MLGLADDLFPRDARYWRLAGLPTPIPFREAAQPALEANRGLEEALVRRFSPPFRTRRPRPTPRARPLDARTPCFPSARVKGRERTALEFPRLGPEESLSAASPQGPQVARRAGALRMPDARQQRRWTKVVGRYALAVSLTGVALAARFALTPELEHHLPFATFFVAVVLTAFVAGPGPTVTAVVLGYLAAEWFFVEPPHAIGPHSGADWARGGAYFAICGIIIVGSTRISRARDRAEASRAELEREASERRRAHDEIRAQRDFNSAVLDTTASLIVVLDTDGNIVRFNRACERLTGWTEVDVKAKNVFELFIPESELRGASAIFRQLRHGDFPIHHRNRWRMKDGSERLIDWSNTAIVDDRGEVKFIIGTGLDITERERAENRIRALYEGELIGLFYWTVDGGVTDANDKFLNMTGYTREDLHAGRIDWATMTPPEYRHLDETALANFKTTGRSLPFEKEYVRKDGTRLPVIIGGAMLDEARYEGVAFVVDITDRKRAEEALRLSDKHKDEFLGVLSHELRNPLAPIRNAVYVLGRANAGSEQAERARTIIERQVDHLTRLVEDLLEVRRIASGKMRLHTAVFDVAHQVRETVEDLRPLFVQHGITLDFNALGGAVNVNGDRTRIAQAVSNLLHNATKFTDPGGHVAVAVEAVRGRDLAARARHRGPPVHRVRPGRRTAACHVTRSRRRPRVVGRRAASRKRGARRAQGRPLRLARPVPGARTPTLSLRWREFVPAGFLTPAARPGPHAAGRMFWFRWNRFRGSYLALSRASRS